ncbi:hypothetical protein BFW01_g11358 [Lasiodiplodia theobromae]|nr:hypothetical protein BFW01_g11358 [Lasiodiplodia theobromae]
MDPFNALGVAAATIQFVDFATALISAGSKICRSKTGELQLESESRTIAEELESHDGEMRDANSNGSGDVSQTEKQIRAMCDQCDAVAQDLLHAVQKLKSRRWSKKEKFETFKQALQAVWTPEQITHLRERLGSWRSQLIPLILSALREQQTRLGSQVPLVQSTAAQNYRNGQRFLECLRKNREYYSEIHDAIRENPRPSGGVYALSSGNEFETGILSALFFDATQNREDAIPDACKGSFEWIFQQPQSENRQWTSFSDWLREDSDQRIYWITGKAGAGKSTLMKFICHNQATRELCYEWAGNERLLHARFYSCDSSNTLQSSQEGLLRSLLYQVLRQDQHFAARAFPDQWEMFSLLGIQPDSPMTVPYLQQGLERVIKSSPDSRFTFFVDGLDEFRGDPDTLAAFFQKLTLSTNIKVCLSARPWTNFKKSYGFGPNLRLEELNYPDILQLTQSSLEKSTDFTHFCKQSPKQAQALVEATAEKASGGFVWVELMLRLLLQGLQDGERLSDLRRRLDNAPSDLEQMFQKMLDSIEPQRAEHASQIFQMVRAARAPISLLCLSFAGEDDPHLPYEHPVEPLTEEQEEARADQMRRRLNSHCKGLLVATPRNSDPQATVDYLHRTVRDYLHRGSVWHHLTSHSSPSSPFDPHLALAHGFLLVLKTARLSPPQWHSHRLDYPYSPDDNDDSTTTTPSTPNFAALLLSTIRHITSIPAPSPQETETAESTPSPHYIPLLDALAHTTRALVRREGPCTNNNTESSRCWCRGAADHPDDGPFTALAVRLQLLPYVAHRLDRTWLLPAEKRREGDSGAAPILHFAVTSESIDYAASNGDGDAEGADVAMVERRARLTHMLLEWGAEPNYDAAGGSGPSPWEEVVMGGGVEEYGEEVWAEFLRGVRTARAIMQDVTLRADDT